MTHLRPSRHDTMASIQQKHQKVNEQLRRTVGDQHTQRRGPGHTGTLLVAEPLAKHASRHSGAFLDATHLTTKANGPVSPAESGPDLQNGVV